MPETNPTPGQKEGRKRVYTAVAVTESETGFGVTLDVRDLHTPGRSLFSTVFKPLAEAVAAEWDAQAEVIDPASMPLTKLLNTAIDRIAPHRTEIVSEMLQYVETDLLCYRAESPESLIERQEVVWQPVLDWVTKTHGIALETGSGLMPLSQSGDTVPRMEKVLSAQEDLPLTALQASAALTGSLALALALVGQKLSGRETFAAAQLDETWQMEQWGEDTDALERRSKLEADLLSVEQFMGLQR